MEQSLMDKLTILADSAKYDVACTSSGASTLDAAEAAGFGTTSALPPGTDGTLPSQAARLRETS